MFKNRKIPHWIILYVVVILLVACAVNGLMYLAVPTSPGLTAPSWLDFWGGYLGGAIGCVPACWPCMITAGKPAGSTRKAKKAAASLQCR